MRMDIRRSAIFGGNESTKTESNSLRIVTGGSTVRWDSIETARTRAGETLIND